MSLGYNWHYRRQSWRLFSRGPCVRTKQAHPPFPGKTCRRKYNIATTATDHRGEVIADIFPCRDSRDKRRSTSTISYGPLLSAGARRISLCQCPGCTASARRCGRLWPRILPVSIRYPSGALTGSSWPRERQSMRRAFPATMFPHALLVMGQRPRAAGRFLVWQANSILTPRRNWRTGAESGVRIRRQQLPSCNRSRTV